jgi:Mg2+-importing ATPase
MGFLRTIVTAPAHLIDVSRGKGPQISKALVESARLDAATVLEKLETNSNGLSEEEYEACLEKYGTNQAAKEKRRSIPARLWDNIKNPLVILLAVLGIVSYLTGDLHATINIGLMVVLWIVLRFFQELRADNAAEKLKAMVSTTATVMRIGEAREIPLKELVPGDIVRLAAGDMAPADVHVLTAKDLFLNQAALTGEALPVEKSALPAPESIENLLEMPSICFLGSNVESGTATAVVVKTGSETYFGSLATSITGQRQLTSFDKGVNSFTWLMISFMLVMVPLVFLFNGLSKHN